MKAARLYPKRDDDAGRALHLHGEKHTTSANLTRGMTTLHTSIAHDGELVASGTLFFDMRTLPGFLSTWRFRRSTSASLPCNGM